ncbi:MAG: radical SAM protein [Deltaproteobacteria bacterium]|nr:radical SAM protein [Deltaproteobacteria bacterium]
MKISFIRPNMAGSRSAAAMHPLAFAVLAGLTPPDIELELFDECIETIPETIETDLAAITVQTFTASRAYAIADRLRSSGIPVILGGYHPTFMPREALKHADAVVIGEAEGIWQQVIADARGGTLAQIYQAPHPPTLDQVVYDRSIFAGKKYAPITPVEFSRGCKLTCEFCSVTTFHKQRHKCRPVHQVIEEIKQIKTGTLFIVDDNIFSNPRIAKQFFEDLVPLKKKWWCQVGINVTRNDHMLDLMAKAGCSAALIGFESLDIENLRQMNKTANVSLHDYKTAIRQLKARGIMVYGSFVFGYDHETPESINRALDFAVENKFFLNNFNTLNPLPGTALYARLQKEKRLLSDAWWLNEKYKYGEVMYRPHSISAADLKQRCMQARFSFNSYSSIIKRLFDRRANTKNIMNAGLFIVGNLIARKEIKRKMKQLSGLTSR